MEEELATLVDRLDKTSAAYGVEISSEKTKMMTSTAKNWTQSTALSSWEQSSQTRNPSRNYSAELYRQQQHCQN